MLIGMETKRIFTAYLRFVYASSSAQRDKNSLLLFPPLLQHINARISTEVYDNIHDKPNRKPTY